MKPPTDGSGGSWHVCRFLGRLWIAAALAVGLTTLFIPGPASAAIGGPVVLMGIDAEEGNGTFDTSHGGKQPYIDVLTAMLSNVSNGGSGVLVFGGGKDQSDDVTGFWKAVGAGATPAQTVTQVNGGAAIASQSFAGFAVVAVASSVGQVPSGGLTDAENAALAGRASDIAGFVNAGGGLFGLSQQGLTGPYDYLGQIGAFTFNFPSEFEDVTATTEGLAVGINDTNLDVCCWHDQYKTFPSFLSALAFNNDTSTFPAAIGGAQVIIDGNIELSPQTDTNPVGTTHTVTAFAEFGDPLVPVIGTTVTFEVTSGPNAGEMSDPNTRECSPNNDCTTSGTGTVAWTYTGTGGPGTDLIAATFVDPANNVQGSNTVEKVWQALPTPTATSTPTAMSTPTATSTPPFPVGGVSAGPALRALPEDTTSGTGAMFFLVASVSAIVIGVAGAAWWGRQRLLAWL